MTLKPTILRNATDSYVVAGVPSANYSSVNTILTKAAGTGSEVRGLIYFPRVFPLGATILSATLRLYQAGAESVSHTIKLQRLTATWSLSAVNWNNQPASTATGEVSLTKAGAASGTEWAWDITALMQTVSAGGAWFGFKIISLTDEYLGFWSAQSTLKPVLEVVWSDNPDKPTTLSPAGNRAVSVAKPVLRFDFTDVSGDTSLQAVQVQINPTNAWTAPAFDSGVVAATEPQLDLNTTAYAGLAAAASTYWRVRVQDGAGLFSDWSDGAQFQRQTQGTLAISNPPVSGLISEPTPPIVWALTGRTQNAWQVFITPSTDGSLVIHNTGKRAGTATSYTLPAGVLTDDSSYTVYVRTWDTISREATPNDTAWVQASRAFTYNYDPTVTGVTSLAVTDLAPAPAATLTWSRATAPDSFIIRRNGIIIASGLTPAQLTTGGTNYAYTDRGANPNQAVTWSVQAVVGVKTSATNPTVTATLKTIGIWLQDPTRNISVQLEGDDPGDWGMEEQATTHSPLGSTQSIRITQALGGYKGTIRGRITTTSGTSLAAQEADMWALKANAGQKYTLALSNISIPVVIGNVVIAPQDDLRTKAVSFDFWQAGQLPFVPNL